MMIGSRTTEGEPMSKKKLVWIVVAVVALVTAICAYVFLALPWGNSGIS
jgi:flagellar basal body-associated protein FliL